MRQENEDHDRHCCRDCADRWFRNGKLYEAERLETRLFTLWTDFPHVTGQQSVAFALLGTKVTVVDLSDAQLERDRGGAAQLGLDLSTLQGDMRDLSHLDAARFDIVYHA